MASQGLSTGPQTSAGATQIGAPGPSQLVPFDDLDLAKVDKGLEGYDQVIANENELALLSAQAWSNFSVETKTRFAKVARILKTHDRFRFGSRANRVPQYVEKAMFFTRCWIYSRGRWGNTVCPFIVFNPDNILDETFVTLHHRDPLRWLTGYCLKMLRGLNFVGTHAENLPGSPSKNDLIEFALQPFAPLGVLDEETDQGMEEQFALARYRILSKLCRVGQRLWDTGLVTSPMPGVLSWDPACDVFDMPGWVWDGQWPVATTTSGYAAAAAPGKFVPNVANQGL